MTDLTEAQRIAPTDADFDDVHHALGRPAKGGGEVYRNYYCCEAGDSTAQRFEALGWWDFGHLINDGRSAIYHVNGAGQQALWKWLGRRALQKE